MRFSSQPPASAIAPVASDQTNEAFFAAVTQSTNESERRGAILLVGGSDYRSLALRRAQAALRYDRRPSAWSHAALLWHWNPRLPARSLGTEVSLDPEDAAQQVPANNGVTEFTLLRYLQSERYPNVAVITLDFADNDAQLKATALRSALASGRMRERYPLWDALNDWARYAYAPDFAPNPLLSGIALPAAALCELCYEAAGVDLTPSVVANNTCPESLWATAQYFGDALAESGATPCKLRVFSLVRDTALTPLPRQEFQLGAMPDRFISRGARAKPKSTPKSAKSKRKARAKSKSKR